MRNQAGALGTLRAGMKNQAGALGANGHLVRSLAEVEFRNFSIIHSKKTL